jgi:class 3 adenylate cyclase
MARLSSFSISIRHALPLLLGLLVLMAVAPVAAISLWAVTDNTGRLVRERQEAILDTLIEKTKSHLDPVLRQMAYAREMIENGSIDPAKDDEFADFMLGVLAATPQVAGIGFLPPEGDFTRYDRASRQPIRETRAQAPLAAQIISRATGDRSGWWGPPFFSIIRQRPTILFFQPVSRGSALLGVFMVAVANEALGNYLATGQEGTNIVPFILVGRDLVMVHPNLDTAPQLRADIPRRDEVGDPVLAGMWNQPDDLFEYPLNRSKSHRVHVAGEWHGFYYRQVPGYGSVEWLIGFHEPRAETSRERIVVAALMVGLPLMLLVALGLAWTVGRALSRRALVIAGQAEALEQLRFGTTAVPALAESPILEMRQTSAALTRAAGALARFETYVPRELVRQLMTLGPSAGQPFSREVSVLFLDLDGFTGFAEGRAAADVAAALNAIFARVGPIIETHGGTIDKYTGDGLLAVWGVPMPEPDHARRASAAACEIAATMTPLLAEARARDPLACRMRIGLHCGPVIAGDLGYEGRIDYTVIGGTVNVAQRVQAAMKPVPEGKMVVIGLTPAFRAAAAIDEASTIAVSETVLRVA